MKIKIILGLIIGALLSYGIGAYGYGSFLYPVSNQLKPVVNTWGINISGTSNLATTTITDLTVSDVFHLGGTVGTGGIDLNGEQLILDPDGGMYLQAATNDNLGIMGGSIGIGTTSPSSTLHVIGDLTVSATSTLATTTIGYLSSATGNISLWTNDSGYITASSADNLTNKTGNISQWTNDSGYYNSLSDITLAHTQVYVGNASNNPTATSTLTILDSGNVGIGTTAPTSKLTITGTDITNGQGRIEYDGSNYTKFIVDSDGDLTISPSGGDVTIDGNIIANSFTGPSGQSVTITMSQESSCTESTDGSEVGVSTSCAQTSAKTQGWVQTNRFQYYTGYSGYSGQSLCGGAVNTWCDSGIDAATSTDDIATSWNKAQTGSVTLTASSVKGAVKYTWTMYADWNGNGNYDSDFLETMWPKAQWTEDRDGDTDGFVGSGDQTWMGIDLNNTYNGGADPDPSDRIVSFNMPTVASSTFPSSCGRLVITVKARDPQGTVLVSGSLTIDPKGAPDLSNYSWTIGGWSATRYGDKMINALGTTYTAFNHISYGWTNSTSTDSFSAAYGVSYRDAQAWCNLQGGRLMTIAELAQVRDAGQTWPTSYVWSLSLLPDSPRLRLILYSDGRVNGNYASRRYTDHGVLCAQ